MATAKKSKVGASGSNPHILPPSNYVPPRAGWIRPGEEHLYTSGASRASGSSVSKTFG